MSVIFWDGDKLLAMIRDLALALLDDQNTGPILRDAGIARNFTDEERGFITTVWKRVSEWSPTMTSESTIMVSHMVMADTVNCEVATTVARWVAAGRFGSVYDNAATMMIRENMITLRSYGQNTQRPKTNFDRTISYADFLRLLKEFVALPELPAMIDHWRSIYEENGENRLDRDVKRAWHPIKWTASQLMYRYGFMMNAPLDSVGRNVIVNKINLDDEADALRAVTNYGGVDTGAKH